MRGCVFATPAQCRVWLAVVGCSRQSLAVGVACRVVGFVIVTRGVVYVCQYVQYVSASK